MLRLSLFICTLFITLSISAQTGVEVIRDMIASTKRINTIEYQMQKKERIEGKYNQQTSFSRVNLNPFKVYLEQKAPKEGLEVLYVEGERNGDALINTNGFPWVNVKLDPNGSTMRKEQHHRLLDSGFDHFIDILEFLVDKYEFDSLVQINLTSVQSIERIDCWKVEFINPHFKYLDYTVQDEEHLREITNHLKINDYRIMEINKNVDSYDDIKKGQVIKIPSHYSPKMTLFIDKDRLIPLYIEVMDDEGLFEQFTYSKVKINPVFDPREFTEDNPEYNF